MYERSTFSVTVEDSGVRASIRAIDELDVAANFRWNAAAAAERIRLVYPTGLPEILSKGS